MLDEIIDHSWDYASEDTKYYTHGIHPYPAMMIPQVSRRLIAENKKKDSIAYDPFCGSGSVLLEFKLAQLQSFGTDINPLAIKISKAKNTILNPEKIQRNLQLIQNEFYKLKFEVKKETIPKFNNIDFWFKDQVIVDLSKLKKSIEIVNNKNMKNFFDVCFSETVRKSSNTRGSEFKLYRINKEKLPKHNPIARELFVKIVERNIAGMQRVYDFSQERLLAETKVIEADITKKIPLDENSIDLIVSSPPYGDSRTTVAYGQFTRLSLQWLGISEEEARSLDKISLGGKTTQDSQAFSSAYLENTINKISNHDEKRAKEVLSFFNDFFKGSENINKVLKNKSKVCWVLGNRTVKNVRVPTDKIISDAFKEFGFKHEKTIIRSIPNKRMPRKNSPTNVIGETVSTMNEEYIVILER